ncbi:Uma2 family endonuclease [Aerosakkonema funiforme]|uniref:Uma2 family endonuclease n=1 Tax=Aerosakkonema funiforme TaxID=1246630 RepID=UPI0035B8B24D
MNLTVKDLERLQTELQEAHLDYQLELVDGRIIVMGPSDYISEEVAGRLITFLNNWVMPRKLGRVTGSSAGFILPNEKADLRAPDVSFVRAERLRNSPRDFVRVVPDLTVEIKSKTDRIKPLKEKIQVFLELGSLVGILIDPDKQKVIIIRRGSEETELSNSDVLTIPELFPGWELPVSELWPPEFE